MKIRFVITILHIGFISISLRAGEYTLTDCEQLAVDNNYEIKNSRLEMDDAIQSRKEAFTNYFPTVEGVGTYFNSDKKLLKTNLGLPGLLPQPIPFSLVKSGTMGGVMAFQPIFVGGRIVNSNRLAKVGEDVSKLQLQLTEDEVVYQTNVYFWQIVNLTEKLETISVIENMLQNLKKDVDMAVQAGVKTRNELLRVELKIHETESNRLTVGNSLEVSKMLLAQFIGVDTENFNIDYTFDGELFHPQNLFRDPDDAVMNRYETKLLEESVNAARLKTKFYSGERLPSVCIGGGYIHNGLMNKPVNAGVIYASVSVPVSGWWSGAHARKRGKISELKAENEMVNSIELMTVEINNVWNEVVESYEQILIAEKSILSSQENLRIVNNSYNAVTVPLSELLDAQVLYQQSRNQYSNAFSEYKMRILKYIQITKEN
ncbi:MAG: TolC family protein [Rikenellaceae bacterium]|nr:TolC family protein [Rikenellaceae bacterium]